MRKSKPPLLPLAEYVCLNDLLPQVERHFPTIDSIRWFYRNHGEQLRRAGAVIVVAGRLQIHPQRFQLTATEIGMAAAERQHADDRRAA
jgi:hypothetical protein